MTPQILIGTGMGIYRVPTWIADWLFGVLPLRHRLRIGKEIYTNRNHLKSSISGILNLPIDDLLVVDEGVGFSDRG